MEAVNGVAEGPPPPSPLTGCYLLIVLGEPHTGSHKDIILQRLAKGLLSWNVNNCLVDLEKELSIVTEQGLEGEEARYGERLIQFASENLVTEILIHPSVSTLAQCIRNLLSSFTRHRHIIHAGYTFAANGSWILQDGTFSLADFSEAFQEVDVQRVIRAYENGISFDIHCSPEGEWMRLPKDSFTRGCKLRVNPDDMLDSGSPAIAKFVNYLSPFLVPAELESTLESSDVVGNIRFSRPTLYVFPGGQGDAALFGINGFNMLVDGGSSRKACFWDFVRHLDRLDAVMLTRLNNSNANGIGAVLRRKAQNAVYPQMGHFFCNIQNRKANLSPDGDKDKDPLVVNLLEEGQELISNLRSLELNPQLCYRDSEPINLYHKVGHGTLDMYVINPAKDSREVKEFLLRWNSNDQKLFANHKFSRECMLPLQNIVSICALLVWRPANPNDTITRILFPGSAPQNKIFEGLDRLKNLECIKHTVCTERTLAPPPKLKSKENILDKLAQPEKPRIEVKKSKPRQIPENKLIEDNLKNGLQNGHAEKVVKKSGSVESDKSETKPPKPKREENKITESNKQEKEKIHKSKPEVNGTRIRQKPSEKKPSPPTPKKTDPKKAELDKETSNQRVRSKISPSATPAKSTKDATNRRVLESKSRAAPKREVKQSEKKEEAKKFERKPISRRPKTDMKMPQSPVKRAINGTHKPDSISRKGKLDRDVTTDSSTVSTPSVDQDPLKKDLSKLTPEEVQQLKAQELAELKEEQEAIKELEAVFRKGDKITVESSDLRKVKDVSIDDKTDTEEYLIVEKEIIEPSQPEESEADAKEEETVKLARDSEESEKKKDESEPDKDTEQEESGIGEQETDLEEGEEILENEISKEASVQSPEENKKIISKEDENKEQAQESQPDEKISANIESGATTTAPTLPEDERIPLNEIKEVDQIEEKHVKEETKEKETKDEVPVITFTTKTAENLAKIPSVVGIRLDKETRIRDIVKTPDEVADLPVHEEVDAEHLSEYSHERAKLKDEHFGDSPVKDEELVSPRKSEESPKEGDQLVAAKDENEPKQDIKITEEKDVKEDGPVEKSPLQEEIDVHIETTESKPLEVVERKGSIKDGDSAESKKELLEKETSAEEKKIHEEPSTKDSNEKFEELTKLQKGETSTEAGHKPISEEEQIEKKEDIEETKDSEKLTEEKDKEELKDINEKQKKPSEFEKDTTEEKESVQQSEKIKSPPVEALPKLQQTDATDIKPGEEPTKVEQEKPTDDIDKKSILDQTDPSEKEMKHEDEKKTGKVEDKKLESTIMEEKTSVTEKETTIPTQEIDKKSRSPSPSKTEKKIDETRSTVVESEIHQIDEKLLEKKMSISSEIEIEKQPEVTKEPSSPSKVEEKRDKTDKVKEEKSSESSPKEHKELETKGGGHQSVEQPSKVDEKADHGKESPELTSKIQEESGKLKEISKQLADEPSIISKEQEKADEIHEEKLSELSPKLEGTDKHEEKRQEPSAKLISPSNEEKKDDEELSLKQQEVTHETKKLEEKPHEETTKPQEQQKIEVHDVDTKPEHSVSSELKVDGMKDNKINEKRKISISEEEKKPEIQDEADNESSTKIIEQEEPSVVKSSVDSRKVSLDIKSEPSRSPSPKEIENRKESLTESKLKKSRSPSPSEIKDIKTPDRKSSSINEEVISAHISTKLQTIEFLEGEIKSTDIKKDEGKTEDISNKMEDIESSGKSSPEAKREEKELHEIKNFTASEDHDLKDKHPKEFEEKTTAKEENSDLASKLISSSKEDIFEKTEEEIVHEIIADKEIGESKTPEKRASIPDLQKYVPTKKEEELEDVKPVGIEEVTKVDEEVVSSEKRTSVAALTDQAIDGLSETTEVKEHTEKDIGKTIDDVELISEPKTSEIETSGRKKSVVGETVSMEMDSKKKTPEKIIGDAVPESKTAELATSLPSVQPGGILSEKDEKQEEVKVDVTQTSLPVELKGKSITKTEDVIQLSPPREEKPTDATEENLNKSPEQTSKVMDVGKQPPKSLPLEKVLTEIPPSESIQKSPERKLSTSIKHTGQELSGHSSPVNTKEQETLSLGSSVEKSETKSPGEVVRNEPKEEISEKLISQHEEEKIPSSPQEIKEKKIDASVVEIIKDEASKEIKPPIPIEQVLSNKTLEVVEKSKEATSKTSSPGENDNHQSSVKPEEESIKAKSPECKLITSEEETKTSKDMEKREERDTTTEIKSPSRIQQKSPIQPVESTAVSQERKSSNVGLREESLQNGIEEEGKKETEIEKILPDEKKSSIEKIESTESFLTRKFSVIHPEKETTESSIDLKEKSPESISSAETSTTVTTEKETPPAATKTERKDSIREVKDESDEKKVEIHDKNEILIDSKKPSEMMKDKEPGVKPEDDTIADQALSKTITGDVAVETRETKSDPSSETKEDILEGKTQVHSISSPSLDQKEKSPEKQSRTASPIESDTKKSFEESTHDTAKTRSPSPSDTMKDDKNITVDKKIPEKTLPSEKEQKAPDSELETSEKLLDETQATTGPKSSQESKKHTPEQGEKKEIEKADEKTDIPKDKSTTQEKIVEQPVSSEKVCTLEQLDNKYAPVLTEEAEVSKDINLNREFLPKKEEKIESLLKTKSDEEYKSEEKPSEDIEKIEIIEKQDHETAETEKGSIPKNLDEKKEIESDTTKEQKFDKAIPLGDIHSFLEQEKMHSHKERGSIGEISKNEDVKVESKEKEFSEKTEHKPEIVEDPEDKEMKSERTTQDQSTGKDEELNLMKKDEEKEQEKGIKEPKEKQITEGKHEDKDIIKTEQIKIDLTDKPEHAEPVLLESTPDSPIINIVPPMPVLTTDIDKAELGRKSPKEREEDVAKIVASVATVLKSDAPLEQFHKQIPLYTTELRETHITTCDSPVSEYDIEEELEKIQESDERESLKNSESTIIVEEEDDKTREGSEETSTVHRMLVTASSEDGGEETEICPVGTITFSRSSESSGRSSPENMSRKLSQTSSILDTISDQTTVKDLTEVQSKKEPVVEEISKSSKGVLEGALKSDVAPHSTQPIYPGIDLKEEVKSLEDQIEEAVRTAKREDDKKEQKQEKEMKSDAPPHSTQPIYPGKDLKEEVKSLKDQIEEAVGTLGRGEKSGDDKKEKQSEIQEILSEAFQEVSRDAEDIKESVTDKIGHVFGSIFSGASKVGEALGHTITDSVKSVETSIDEGLKKVETELGEVKHKIEDVESKVVDTLVENKEKAEHIVADHLRESASALSDTIDKTDKAKDSFVQHTEDTLDKMAAPLRETLGDALSNLAESLKQKEEKIVTTKPEEKESETIDTITNFQDATEDEVSKWIVESGGEISQQIYPSLKDATEKVEKSIGQGNLKDPLVDGKESTISSLISDATKDIEKVLGEVEGIHKTQVEETDKKVSNLKEELAEEASKGKKELVEEKEELSKHIDDKIGTTIKAPEEDLSGLIQKTTKTIEGKISDVQKSLDEKSEKKTNELKENIENVLEKTEEALEDTKDGLVNGLVETVTDTKEKIEELKSKGDKEIEKLKDEKDVCLDAVKSVEDVVSTKISETSKEISAGIAEASESAKNIAQESQASLDSLKKDLQHTEETFKKEAESSIEKFMDDVKSLSSLIEKNYPTKEETHEKDSLQSRLETKAENMINTYTDEIKDTLKDSAGNIEEDAGLSFETIKHDIDVKDMEKDIAEENAISDISNIVREEIDSSLKGLTGAEKSVTQEVSNISDSLKSAVDTGHSLKEDTKTAIKDVGSIIASKSDELVEKSKEEIEKKVSDLKTEVEGTKTAIIEKAESASKDITDTKEKVEEALNETKENLEASISNMKQDLEKEKEALVTAGKEIESEVKHAVEDVFDAGKKLFGGLFGSKKDDKKPTQPKESSILKDTPEVSGSDRCSSGKCEGVDKDKCDLMGTLGLGKSGDISETCDISKGDVQTHLGLEVSQEKKLSISDVEIFVDDKGKDSSTECDLKTAKEDGSKRGVDEKPHIKPEGSDINRLDKHITDVPSEGVSPKKDVQNVTSDSPCSDSEDFHHKMSEMDPMMMSFYGALPDDDILDDGDDTSGRSEVPLTHLHDLTKAKFEGKKFAEGVSQLPKQDPMTSSFYGELPDAKDDKDPIGAWGKPLGLPSPAPPNEKGTPKKERKLPSNVMAKNRINDDRARSESPSKNKKKVNPVYVDLTYVPHHGNSNYAYVDFFKRVRARYYVFSGIEPSREVYNALLEAKQTWEDKDLEVTIIPTYDTDVLGYWVAENEELLTKYKIDLSPSASRCTINLQDHETSCSAYRLEF